MNLKTVALIGASLALANWLAGRFDNLERKIDHGRRKNAQDLSDLAREMNAGLERLAQSRT